MANKRILQFDTAEQLEDDDYLLIDHQDEGTRKILASAVGGGGSSSSEVIPISAGDGTTSRTFTFTKTPKFIKFYWKDPYVELGWYLDASLVWGQDWLSYLAYYLQIAVQGSHSGTASVSYNGNSITITGGNAFGAMNSTGGSGYMYVEY